VADLGSSRKGEVDSFGILHRLRLPLVAVVFCLLASVLSWPWNMISGIAAVSVLIIAVVDLLYRWYKRKARSKLLKTPFETHFLIPAKARHDLGYGKQNEKEHHVDTLTLPANSVSDILVWARSNVDLEVDEISLGCEGSVLKPEPLSWINYFVARGKSREFDPDSDPDHYVDWWGHYHVRNVGAKLTKGDVRVLGLKMKVKDKGVFPFKIIFHSPEGEGQATLTIRVD
jgi:hypothetical protein